MKSCGLFKNLSLRSGLALAALASGALLSAALVAQYGFGLHPCELCIYQRIPYAAIVAVGLVGWFAFSQARYALLWLCAGLFLLDAGIASYHAGVEWGIFAGPDACSSSGAGGESLEDMRQAIMNAPLVPCNQAMTYIFGLSMAAWNALAAAALAAFTSAWLLCRGKHG